ncbi:hypothetical protein TNCV_4429361 [Trichonephila clavipes]|nr:hypothetical protein TNCV_4429361 [Trichonephila clavipes]
MSSFLVLCEGDTKNRWRDGQVCPDVRQGTMAPWARRLGCVLACYTQIGRGREKEKRERSEEEDEKSRERTDGRSGKEAGRERRRKENGEETRGDERRQERRRKKRAESGDWSGKTMNADGVENGNMN